MNFKSILTFLLLGITLTVFAQKNPAYVIYNKKGKKVSYKKVLKKLKKSDIILFGEFHNNPISHWLELEISKDLAQTERLLLGAEMFERDNQEALNQYLAGKIDKAELDTLARLWSNYKTDYAPLVNFAKKNKIPFTATNIPRRLANLVYKNGGFAALDKLTTEEKTWVAPLPIVFDATLPMYQEILTMMGSHGTPDLVKAQAIKDATMAYSILKDYKSESIYLHLNGAFHSDFHEGILWYLQQENDKLNYITISTVEQKNIKKLESENVNRADFIICVDDDMTKTY